MITTTCSSCNDHKASDGFVYLLSVLPFCRCAFGNNCAARIVLPKWLRPQNFKNLQSINKEYMITRDWVDILTRPGIHWSDLWSLKSAIRKPLQKIYLQQTYFCLEALFLLEFPWSSGARPLGWRRHCCLPRRCPGVVVATTLDWFSMVHREASWMDIPKPGWKFPPENPPVVPVGWA